MAGNFGSPDPAGHNPHPMGDNPRPAVDVSRATGDHTTHSSKSTAAKVFECINCGAPVTLRFPSQSLSVVCDHCNSIIDVSNENYQIIQRYNKATLGHTPIIPLGVRGELRGQKWEVIGFLVRMDEASSYSWEEYLLFNPFHGYRWLTVNDGHWNFVQTIKEKPEVSPAYISGKGEVASHEGETFQLYYRGNAAIYYVLGEFYWKVTAGKAVQMHDYICPPKMLSCESDHHEVVWSVSEYIKPSEVRKAFNIEGKMPFPQGIAPNQPTYGSAQWKKVFKLWLLFLALLTLGEVGHLLTSSNKIAYSGVFPYMPNAKSDKPITTPVFVLDKHMANVKLQFHADVDNDWFYTDGELVNADTGTSYPIEKTVEYYHGYEDGESWSEGSHDAETLISAVPGGNYYLNLDTESGNFPNSNPQQFVLIVKRDVPTYANYLWCLLFLSLFPGLTWIMAISEEKQRWSNSDFSPYASSS